MSQAFVEEIAPPDISHLILEDDTPVDNFQSEKQQRLLVESLYSSFVLSDPFIAAANVGIFSSIYNEEGIAPDTLQEAQRAEEAETRARQFADRLRSMGVDPDQD